MHTKPLVVAATHAEIAPCIPLLDRLYIPYLVTGVGMVATTYSLTTALAGEEYAYILNVGIAGSFRRDLPLGAVVEVSEDIFSDLGAEDKGGFLSIDALGFGQSAWSSCPPSGLILDLPRVQAVTVNTVHGVEDSIAMLLQRYPHVVAESMEGAAVFYVCHRAHVPCVQVRAISNYVEARNRDHWDIPLAIRQLNSWLDSFFRDNG